MGLGDAQQTVIVAYLLLQRGMGLPIIKSVTDRIQFVERSSTRFVAANDNELRLLGIAQPRIFNNKIKDLQLLPQKKLPQRAFHQNNRTAI